MVKHRYYRLAGCCRAGQVCQEISTNDLNLAVTRRLVHNFFQSVNATNLSKDFP